MLQGLNLDGNGELQIIHATEEQLVHLQQTHQIQILDDNQVPAELLQQLQVSHVTCTLSFTGSACHSCQFYRCCYIGYSYQLWYSATGLYLVVRAWIMATFTA